jgi:4-diphosphocytidyl-2-C-methyl-D-erythritol kinase
MSRPKFVRALAPAKVNLRLEILGRREDGYHEVRTWMLALGFSDRVEARANDGGGVSLSVSGEQAGADVPNGSENLAWRAASALLDEGRRRGLLGAHDGLELVLEKSIPSRAGLGGGSSDAAAAWIAAERALGIELPSEAAGAALSALGSDCAFFALARSSGCALCEGRGERVTPLAGPPLSVALVVPRVECPTSAVYAALDERTGGKSEASGAAPAIFSREFLWNGLEEAALAAFPDLRRWRRLLDASGADAWRLSGSGSAFFGVYGAPEEASLGLSSVVRAASQQGLAVRAAWSGSASGQGAKIVEVG